MSAVDKRLEQLADRSPAGRLQRQGGDRQRQDGLRALQGAVLRATLAEARRGRRAHRSALLWASTSTKSPAYRDTMYVEELIGRDTVNTIPPATMDAFRDHGEVKPDSVEKDEAGAKAVLAELEKQGISLRQITDELVEEGVQSFADPSDKLLGVVAERRRTLADGKDPTWRSCRRVAPDLKAAFEAEMEAWRKYGNVRKLWAGDKTLWTGSR